MEQNNIIASWFCSQYYNGVTDGPQTTINEKFVSDNF